MSFPEFIEPNQQQLIGKRFWMKPLDLSQLPEPDTEKSKEVKKRLQAGEFFLIPGHGADVFALYDITKYNNKRHAKDTFINRLNGTEES